MERNLFKTNVREICEISVMTALAVVMDRFVRIPVGATGGSINISTLPLFIIALRHGWFKGFLASGVVYGIITCLFDQYGIITYPFEYLIAFGSIGISGLFGRKIFKMTISKDIKTKILSGLLLTMAVVIFFVIRLLFNSFDSMIIYEYNFISAILYNIEYVGPSALGVLIFLIILLPIISTLNKTFRTDFLEGIYDEE